MNDKLRNRMRYLKIRASRTIEDLPIQALVIIIEMLTPVERVMLLMTSTLFRSIIISENFGDSVKRVTPNKICSYFNKFTHDEYSVHPWKDMSYMSVAHTLKQIRRVKAYVAMKKYFQCQSDVKDEWASMILFSDHEPIIHDRAVSKFIFDLKRYTPYKTSLPTHWFGVNMPIYQ